MYADSGQIRKLLKRVIELRLQTRCTAPVPDLDVNRYDLGRQLINLRNRGTELCVDVLGRSLQAPSELVNRLYHLSSRTHNAVPDRRVGRRCAERRKTGVKLAKSRGNS